MSEQEREKESSFLSFLAGVGLGAIFGTAIALLLAPQSGRETKEDLKEAVTRIEEGAKGLAGRVRKTAGRLLKQEEEAIARAVREGREEAARKRRELLDEMGEEAGNGT